MHRSLSPAPKGPERRRRFWGALGGAAAGFLLASAIYLLLTPALEAGTGLIRELQGPSWNLVPGLTLLGGVAGWLLSGPRRPSR